MNDYTERATEVAFTLNANLPEEFQKEIYEEECRCFRKILTPRRLAKRKILIVGGAGYIGSVLTRRLLGRGYVVRCLDMLLYGNEYAVYPYIHHPSYEFLFGDFTKPDVAAKALEEVTDVVILAGLVGDPITKIYPEESRRINLDGMKEFIARLNGRKLNKVIFVSTCSNYGLIENNELADEEHELKPLSLYAQAKTTIEKKILSLKGSVDYCATILRFATAFGLSPRMRFDLTVSEFTREMFLGNELLVYDAETWRPYCHVEDFSTVISRVFEASANRVASEVFNAGGDANNYTKKMIADTIKELIPDARVAYKEHGSDPRNYRVNFAKIEKRLCFKPEYTVKGGIRELIAAMKQGLFHNTVEKHKNYYGNYKINYERESQ